MKSKLVIAMVLILVTVGYGFGQKEDGISIYVYAQTSPDGFVDSSRTADSVKDLIGNLAKRKGITIAPDAKSADITIEVLSSGTVVTGVESETRVRRGVLGGVNATTTAENKTLPSLTVMLRVRKSDYAKELSITRQMFWKDLAKNIANQTITWINTNWTQIQKTLDR